MKHALAAAFTFALAAPAFAQTHEGHAQHDHSQHDQHEAPPLHQHDAPQSASSMRGALGP
ncbi:MAG: hypothetical protein AB7O04_03390 [Hyphomonadaceae bacterium]